MVITGPLDTLDRVANLAFFFFFFTVSSGGRVAPLL